MSSDNDDPQVPVGSVIAGKYRVERLLGAGGMGFVVAATHLELHQLVAVKFLHTGALANREAVQRFMREAQAAARIKSEHVARVIDVSRLADGEPYMVLEYLDGQDLGALLRDGPLAFQDAVDYVGQACHALAEAHSAGIVHRDLKPSNLFLVRQPDGASLVKVLDFGISKLSSGIDPQLTKTSAMMGSPLYMSPEQMKSSRDVDPRSDIWSLGVMLYELLSGKPPFTGETLPELITAVVTAQPVSLATLRPDTPAELLSVVQRCLEKDPTLRYQSIAELARELLPLAPRHSQLLIERVARLAGPSKAPIVPVAPAAPAVVSVPESAAVSAASGTAAPWSQTRPVASGGKRMTLWVTGGMLALLGAGLAGARFSTATHSADTSSAEPSVRQVAPPAPAASPTVAALPAESAVPAAASAPEALPTLPVAAASAAAKLRTVSSHTAGAPPVLPKTLPTAAAKGATPAVAAAATVAPTAPQKTLDIPLK